jgi:hypothetical protein
VFDGSLDVHGKTLLTKGELVKVLFKDGYATKVLSTGNVGRRLDESIKLAVGESRKRNKGEDYVRAVTNLGEFGLGLNPKAKIVGIMLEDEKVLETVHFALGSNKTFGGKTDAINHWDGLVNNPTVVYDDKTLMKNGKIVV